MEDIRFIDLFAGLSGTRIGFEEGVRKAGKNPVCVMTSDVKSAAHKAHAENFKGETVMGDITKIESKDIPDCDYILGGFPCQPFSQAGSRKGFSDTRGTLFFEIERIAKDKNVKGMILENVENFERHDNGNTVKTVVSHLEALGYNVSYKVLDASEYGGVPQKRKRIYIVALKDRTFDFSKIKKSDATTVGDIREYGLPVSDTEFTKKLLKQYTPAQLQGKQIVDKRGGKNVIHSWDFGMMGDVNDRQKKLLEAIKANHRKKQFAEELGIKWRDGMPLNLKQIKSFIDYPELESDIAYLESCGYLAKKYPYKSDSLEYDTSLPIGYKIITGRLIYEFNRVLDDKGVCVTLTATDAKKIAVAEKKGIRGLSRRECLRLLGFPEWYTLDTVSDAEMYDLIGNSIVVPIISKIAEQILTPE